MAKRIVSGVFALVIMFFACLPRAYALGLPDISVNFDVVEFFQWTSGMLGDTANFWASQIWSKINDDVCPFAPSVGGRHNFVEKRTQVDGKLGLYYVCEYCGKSAGEVAEKAYEEYVSDLPAMGYNSDGSLLIYPKNHSYYFKDSSIKSIIRSVCPHYTINTEVSGNTNCDYLFNCDEFTVIAKLKDGMETFALGKLYVDFFFETPITGFYSQYYGGAYSGYYISSSSSIESFGDVLGVSDSLNFYSAGYSFFSSFMIYPTSYSIKHFYVQFNPIVYKVTPSELIIDEINITYNSTTRPTTITGGNYGIVGDNGELTVVNGDIINETNNTYYNPATGNTETITNWSYDYSDRSYSVTLGDGSTAKVTYGDENITIIEGDVTYNIYYIIEGSGGGSDSDPDPSATPDLDPFESSGPGYPPEPSSPPSGGGDDTGLFEWLDNLIQYLREHLSGAVDLVKSFFTEIPGLFNGFLEFLSAMFPFIPDEIMLLFTFGIAAVVFVGIIKAIRR